MQARQGLLGIAYTIIAAGCFAVLDTTVQYLSGFVPLLMALWWRYTFQTVVAAAMLAPKRGLRMLRTERPGLHVLRGALLMSSTGFAFASLKVMPVSEFTAVVMITPLAITLIAATALKQHVSALRWALVIVSFLATMVIIRPFGHGFNITLLLPLACVVGNAAFQLLTSRMTLTEDTMTMQLSTGLVGMLLASLTLPFVFVWITDWTLWSLLVLMGISSSAGHLLLIKAFQKAAPAALMPYQYAQIAFALLAGYLVFRYVPDQWSVLGMAVIALCGALGAWLTVHEGRQTRQNAAAVATASAAL
jgi:drug/metabolite transporter (DMT)-like permease